MRFRSLSDMNDLIIANLGRLPRDIDLIVGIPRSGMITASLFSLYLNLPMTDVDGFIEGRLMQSGFREVGGAGSVIGAAQKVLVVDDSVGHGTQLLETQRRLREHGLTDKCVFAAPYVTPDSKHLVEYAFEVLPWGFCFEWNVMHHGILGESCVDIDGVLCVNPTCEEDDDGERYRRFLDTTPPLFLPSVEIGWLVSCRLEKYRDRTVGWLQRHGVKYRELVMLDLPNKEARAAARSNGVFKGKVYRASGARLFVESCPYEAGEIARTAGLPVLCLTTHEMVYPGLIARLPAALARTARSPGRPLRRVVKSALSMWRHRSRPSSRLRDAAKARDEELRIRSPGARVTRPDSPVRD